ncbi:cyclic AMP-responsive element-binding protein isoform X4 [Coccinella septempunctata]|uniref:cyclic AMP-responsive element-binding protein isoform X4 n=1 Tax=Coccinella septempunctata TaxID=41139 RepID=UPI001D073C93|nr:cyclic AMP-responsive element-binding protein isoform X4 [Coccinella septempunctata]
MIQLNSERSTLYCAMDSMVDENGSVDPLAPSPDPQSPISVSVGVSNNSQPHLVTATNIVQLTLPTTQTQAQVQSVIQPNQQSVIQTAANLQPMLSKGNVILVSKPNSVIQTTQGSLQTLQVVETASDESFSEDECPKKRRDLLSRRPSYRKILNDLGGGEIAGMSVKAESIEAKNTSNLNGLRLTDQEWPNVKTVKSEKVDYEFSVLPATAIQISSGEGGGHGLHTLTMTNSTQGGAIVQYAQGQEFYVPVVAQSGSISGQGEDQSRKREMRLLKNREAARECRRKKKEYIKCLENRVAVLENQNKTLMDELKALKDLYCSQKVE